MVSFQCNGCADVLTKPKLDKHRATCHSSFDCIDCSKRFESPADYKGHTSCISEAEKYQKALYNGGNQSGPGRGGRNQRSGQHGGGRQWGNNQSQWQQRNVNRATGANDTPLGTPVRMSPVNDTPVVDENTQKDRPAAETSKKRKAEVETTEPKDTSEPAKKKKKRKNTDHAPETAETNGAEAKFEKKGKPTLEVTNTEGQPQDPRTQPVEDGDVQKKVDKMKRKKEKEEKEGARKDGKEETKKEKRKKKKEPPPSGQEPISRAKVTATAQQPVTEASPPIDAEEPARSTKKKSKSKEPKSKSKAEAADQAQDVPKQAKPPVPIAPEVAGAQDDQTDRKKKKKCQSSDYQGDNGVGKLVVEGNDGTLKGKRKEKRKRKSEGQTVSVVE